jgi:tetratricopeptide (TPR) repeat protein
MLAYFCTIPTKYFTILYWEYVFSIEESYILLYCIYCNIRVAMEEYKVHAEALKDQGNESFKAGDMQKAIDFYTQVSYVNIFCISSIICKNNQLQAIDMDPDNHVYYSNRSAAYMKADSISKALRDGEKCVELAPNWSKGYSRLGAAQQALKRFDACLDSYKKGIELDGSNKTLWSALRSAEEAKEVDKKQRFAAAALEREAEAKKLREKDEARKQAIAPKTTKKQESEEDILSSFFFSVAPEVPPEAVPPTAAPIILPPIPTPSPIAPTVPSGTGSEGDAGGGSGGVEGEAPAGEDGDLLAGFFSELSEADKKKEKKAEDAANEQMASLLTEKYTNQDLGTGISQYERLTATNYQWKNQNPYRVMQLDIDATEDDIKYRYWTPPTVAMWHEVLHGAVCDVVKSSRECQCVYLYCIYIDDYFFLDMCRNADIASCLLAFTPTS